jgi:hypothetical protein
MVQERKDLEISWLYLDIAAECFNKAALEGHADGAEIFRRMGRCYISEAELYDPTSRSCAAGVVAWPMTLNAEHRRALAMLATPGHNGATRPFLIAHGFGGATFSALVNRGFVTLTAEKIRADGKTIDVSKVRITAAGRDALASED